MLRLLKFGECKECIAVLKVLLQSALACKTRGLVILHRPLTGNDQVYFTGIFKASAEAAMVAAVRIERDAAHQLDLFDGD